MAEYPGPGPTAGRRPAVLPAAGEASAVLAAGTPAAGSPARAPIGPLAVGRSGADHRPVPGGPAPAPPERPEPSHAGRPAWPAAAGGGGGVRRATGDPVKVLLHRHRELCERAADPLEIAAGLEACGVTDRAVARYRHRDVFSLAEELYARVPRDLSCTPDGARRPGGDRATGSEPDADLAPVPGPACAAPHAGGTAWHAGGTACGAGRGSLRRRGGRALAALLPAAVCAAALAVHARATGPLLIAVTAAGAAGLAAALVLAVRSGPLRAPRRAPLTTWAATLLLVLYAAYGDGLLDQLAGTGPVEPPPPATAPLLGLAAAVAPAALCARLFAVRARRRLAVSRALDDFTAGVRPLLLAVVALQLVALTGLLAAARLVPGTRPGALAPAVALGALLFLARLLAVYGFPRAGSIALGGAAAAQALACLSLLAGRLPGCDAAAVPVRRAVESWGAAAVPGAVCTAAALVLLGYACAVLARASAHARR
ncbi:hypothetical protein BG846_05017 [Streptomyces fradiae ATCC 10745 = DSM 40063]|uniref:Integral membrane protein n=1 Tax=Streptomyces fradiae ATCC 10745 = DSM 40063 TaxID=1319510 RepID=A0A1Y2NPT1_STRFR|nr:hypothetical protein BG846_05017 [Streptomyces fradiae ATCC 10745 = DSM 40063]